MKTRLNSRSLSWVVAAYFLNCLSSLAQAPSDYLITGRVFDESNQAVEKVRVCAEPEDYNQVPKVACGWSDTDGNFVIRPGRSAHYLIFASKPEAGYQPQVMLFYRNPNLPLIQVVLTESIKTVSISVPLGPKNGALIGKAVDAATHRPVENVLFRMCHAAGPKICWTTPVKNAAGEFDVNTAHVPFTLKITSDGYEDWWGLSGFDKDSPISVASGVKTELICLLKRKSEFANRPMSEAEKTPGVNLPAPVQLSPPDRAEFNFYPRQTKLEWEPLEGAASYTVELDYCDGDFERKRECLNPKPLVLNGNPRTTMIVGTSYEFKFLGAQPGRWRVWAVDKTGQEGFKSLWRLFFYLR